MKFLSKWSSSIIFFLLISLSTQVVVKEDQSCESPEGPLKLCLLHQHPTGFKFQYTNPKDNEDLWFMSIVSTIEDKEENKNYTFEYAAEKKDKTKYWIDIGGLEKERKYSFYLQTNFENMKNNEVSTFEAHMDLEFSCDLNLCVDQEMLRFVNEDTRAHGNITWTYPPGYYDDYEYPDYLTQYYGIQNTEKTKDTKHKNFNGMKMSETSVTNKIVNLKENTTYLLLVSSHSGDAITIFRTKVNYTYPIKPTDFEMTEEDIPYGRSLVEIKWKAPLNSLDKNGTLRNSEVFIITLFDMTRNKISIRRRTTNSVILDLKSCSKYKITVRLNFQHNKSYSENSFEFSTRKMAPTDASVTNLEVKGQNVTITYRPDIHIHGCPPIGHRINATGISTWDDVVDVTEVFTIYENKFTFTNLHPATKYTFMNAPFNEAGEFYNWNLYKDFATTEESIPYRLTSMKVDQDLGKSLKIQWTPAPKSPGKVLRYWIELYDVNSMESVYLSSVPANARQLNIQRQDLRDRQILVYLWPENSFGNGTHEKQSGYY